MYVNNYMEQKRRWPQDYNNEEIRTAIETGAVRESGFGGAKEAGLAEILIRSKKSTEKSDRRNFWISIAILIISGISLLISIFR